MSRSTGMCESDARATAMTGNTRMHAKKTKIIASKLLTAGSHELDNSRLVSAEGYSSGQRGQTVNLLAMPT